MARTYRVGNRKSRKDFNRGFSTGYNGCRSVRHGSIHIPNQKQQEENFLLNQLYKLLEESENK